MSIYERIKEIRKISKLSQQEFSDKINIERSSLAHFEIGRREPKDIHITAICREFDINEHWLRTGEGEMFVKNVNDEIERLAVKYDLNKLETSLISEYVKMNKEHRSVFLNYLKNVFNNIENNEETSVTKDHLSNETKDKIAHAIKSRQNKTS